jgi:acyl-CoA thioesterase-2
VPILYEVDRIRDGRSFTTRRVVAVQHGRAIFNLSASFHDDEEGLEHQFPMPEVPDPESLAPSSSAWSPGRRSWPSGSTGPTRSTSATSATCPGTQGVGEPYQRLWIRADGELPDDPLLHACVATYASDMSLFDTILAPHETRWDDPDFMGASLDHCMWFHRPSGPTNGCSTTPTRRWPPRGAAWPGASCSTARGRLCVSLVQEGLVRMRPTG